MQGSAGTVSDYGTVSAAPAVYYLPLTSVVMQSVTVGGASAAGAVADSRPGTMQRQGTMLKIRFLILVPPLDDPCNEKFT